MSGCGGIRHGQPTFPKNHLEAGEWKNLQYRRNREFGAKCLYPKRKVEPSALDEKLFDTSTNHAGWDFAVDDGGEAEYVAGRG